jgi:hypothetical protein
MFGFGGGAGNKDEEKVIGLSAVYVLCSVATRLTCHCKR